MAKQDSQKSFLGQINTSSLTSFEVQRQEQNRSMNDSLDRMAGYKYDATCLIVNRISKQMRKTFSELKNFAFGEGGYPRRVANDSFHDSFVSKKRAPRKHSLINKPPRQERERSSLEMSRKNLRKYLSNRPSSQRAFQKVPPPEIKTEASSNFQTITISSRVTPGSRNTKRTFETMPDQPQRVSHRHSESLGSTLDRYENTVRSITSSLDGNLSQIFSGVVSMKKQVSPEDQREKLQALSEMID